MRRQENERENVKKRIFSSLNVQGSLAQLLKRSSFVKSHETDVGSNLGFGSEDGLRIPVLLFPKQEQHFLLKCFGKIWQKELKTQRKDFKIKKNLFFQKHLKKYVQDLIKKAIKSSQDEKHYKRLNHYFDFIKEIKK